MSNNVAVSGVRVALVALLVLVLGALAHAQSATPRTPAASLERHCADIRDVFELARFTGEFKRRAEAFVAGGCVGPAPVPHKSDSYNVQRWNASAGILQNGGGIVIAPN